MIYSGQKDGLDYNYSSFGSNPRKFYKFTRYIIYNNKNKMQEFI